tara:strand:- start:206 stop:826 length:621 start_codon:yes stop_codon:yes gene_type:complete
MKKIYLLLLPLLANISFADMSIVSYTNSSADIDNSNIDIESDQFSYSLYNSSNRSAWGLSAGFAEYTNTGSTGIDADMLSVGYSKYFADRTSEPAQFISADVAIISLDVTSNASLAYESDSILYSLGGGIQFTPEEGFGYFAGLSLDILVYDDDASNGVALDTETDLGYELGVSYALSNGIRFTAGIGDASEGASSPTRIGVGYQF